jgi:hypothetical protein
VKRISATACQNLTLPKVEKKVTLPARRDDAAQLGTNFSAETVHFIQNSVSSRKGILDFIAVFG